MSIRRKCICVVGRCLGLVPERDLERTKDQLVKAVEEVLVAREDRAAVARLCGTLKDSLAARVAELWAARAEIDRLTRTVAALRSDEEWAVQAFARRDQPTPGTPTVAGNTTTTQPPAVSAAGGD